MQSTGQAKVLQVVVAVTVAQEAPPKLAAVMMERVLVLEPVPQDLVQAPYLDQEETLQSTGQAKVLQVVVWRSDGQEAPPCWTALMTDLVRYLVPTEQDLVQAVKADQPESLQSMGQAKVLQVGCSRRCTQPRPPKAAEVRTERVRVLVPVPQVLVQADQAVQRETLQSTGQAWRLQTRSCSEGHSSPP